MQERSLDGALRQRVRYWGLGVRPSTLRRLRVRVEMVVDGSELGKVPELSAGEVRAVAALMLQSGVAGMRAAGGIVPGLPALPAADPWLELVPGANGFGMELGLEAVSAVDLEGLVRFGALCGAECFREVAFREWGIRDLVMDRPELVEARGGDRDWREVLRPALRCQVVVLSDSVAAGLKKDKAGVLVVERLRETGAVNVEAFTVLPDEPTELAAVARSAQSVGVELLLTVGGTGLWRRDRTVEALMPLMDREIPGIMEAVRAYGQARTPRAMLSRGICGMMGEMMVLTLPGSSRGALESCDALLPSLLHAFRMLRSPLHSAEETHYKGKAD